MVGFSTSMSKFTAGCFFGQLQIYKLFIETRLAPVLHRRLCGKPMPADSPGDTCEKSKKKNRCFRGNMPDMNFGNFGCEVVWLWLRINKHWSYHWRSKIAQHTCHNLQLEQSNESNSEWIPSPKMSLLKQQMEFGRASFFPASKRAMDICKSSSKAVLIGWSATVEEVGCGHKMDAYKMEKENRKPKIMKRMSKSEPSTEFRIQWW